VHHKTISKSIQQAQRFNRAMKARQASREANAERELVDGKKRSRVLLVMPLFSLSGSGPV
jgi:hypothetical protein